MGMVSFNPILLTLSAREDGQPHLLGSKCCSCGKVYFPQDAFCTQCLKVGTLKEHPLSCSGRFVGQDTGASTVIILKR